MSASPSTSVYVQGCINDERTQYNAFNSALSSATTDPQGSIAAIAKVAYWLDLDAGGMESEVRNNGAVAGGDRCFYEAALQFDLMSGLFPDGSANHDKLAAEAHRFFSDVVTYYPSSSEAADAQQKLDAG